MSLRPVRLARDAEGNPWSSIYEDVYSSRDGALGQATHVFLNGNGLPARWRGRNQFVILETGFGLGVNFLATWRSWRDDPQRPERLHFVSVEQHPLPAEDLLAAMPAELRELAEQLVVRWPMTLPGLHRLEFESGRVVLTLAFGDARDLVPELQLGADAIYLDGFAPARNPQMWETTLLKAVARCARPGATVATYTSAPVVREALAVAGFDVQPQVGFGHKRRMLAGHFMPRWRVRRHEPPAEYHGERSAIVVGAGLAGAGCADALARRGWHVRVIDRQAHAVGGASALPWGLVHPQFALDDPPLARLTRAGLAATLAALERAVPDGDFDGVRVARNTGVLQVAGDVNEVERWREAVERIDVPAFVQWCTEEIAAERIGMRPRTAGIWWPAGAIVAPARWCRAIFARHSIFPEQADVGRIVADGSRWQLLDRQGAAIAMAPVVIVAAAMDSPSLLGMADARLRPVRGRIALLHGAAWAALRAPVTGDGYLLRDPDGGASVGATYEDISADGELTDERAVDSNLARIPRLLALSPRATVVGTFDGIRCVAHDRLPHAGVVADEAAMQAAAAQLRGSHLADLPRHPGLVGCFALGSRGLTLAPLLAESIAAHIEGEPLPVERDLAAAVDPARFALRAVRRGRDLAADVQPAIPEAG